LVIGNWKQETGNRKQETGTRNQETGTRNQEPGTRNKLELAAIIIITLSLSASCYSVALNSSVYRCIEWGETFRMAFVFAFAQAVMLGLGWLIGSAIAGWLSDMAFPIAIMVLFFIGARLFMESRRRSTDHRIIPADNTRWMSGFAFLTGINTFLTGIGMGILTGMIWHSIVILAALAFFMTIFGIRLGKTGAIRSSRITEALAGITLILVALGALVMVVSH